MLRVRERKRLHKVFEFRNGRLGEFVYILARNRDCECFGFEPLSAALGARHFFHIFGNLVFYELAVRFVESAHKISCHALVTRLVKTAERARVVFHRNTVAVVAEKDDVEDILRQVFKRRIERKTVRLRKSLELHLRHMSRVPAAHLYRAVFEGFVPVGDEQVYVDFVAESESAAFGTRTVRIVEREQSRREFFKTQIAIGASVLCGIQHFFAVEVGNHKPFGQFYRVFDCVGYAALRTVLNHDSVDNHAYVMLYVFVEFYFLVEGVVHPVHPHAYVACALELFQFLAVLALSSSHDGREKLKFCPLSFHNLVANLVNRLAFDFTSALGAMRRADSCKQQAEVVVNFRHRAHGRARVMRGSFLVD